MVLKMRNKLLGVLYFDYILVKKKKISINLWIQEFTTKKQAKTNNP